MFGKWIEKESPAVEFERYADDIIVHCRSLNQAEYVLRKIEERLKKYGFELHPDKMINATVRFLNDLIGFIIFLGRDSLPIGFEAVFRLG